MKKNIILILLLTMSLTLFSQEAEGSDGMGMGIGLSNQILDGKNYQSIALMPEVNLGFFGIGLNIDMRFTLDIDLADPDNPTPEFAIFEDDWIIEDGDIQDYLSLYLPKIAYIRLGHKNEDFYLKAGQFTRATLGNGSILSDYSNTQFMPESKVFGLAFDLDGALFNFPYLGFESFIGNLAAMDVIGGRFYLRPFKALSIPVISNLEIAASGVIDRAPYFYNPKTDTTVDPDTMEDIITEIEMDADEQVFMYGIDLTIPFVDTAIFSMDIFGDLVFQNESSAQIYGLGGQIISLINYRVEYIDQQENYVAQYFNAAYDLNRTGTNFDIYHGNVTTENEIPAKQDMAATLGFSIPKILYFDARIGGLLTLLENDPDRPAANIAPQLYPSLKGSLRLDNELLKIVSADFFYLKSGIDTFESIIDPTNALIGGAVNYHQGSMVVSFILDIKYNGDLAVATGNPEDAWVTNTQLAVNFQL